MSDDAVEERTVVPYDFRDPSRITPDRQSRLEIAHEQLADAVERWVRGQVRAPFDLVLGSISQTTYRQFLSSLPDVGATYVYHRREATADSVALSIEPNLAFHLLERMAGGTPLKDPPSRALTKLETAVVQLFTDRVMSEVDYVWGDSATLDLQFSRFESVRELIEAAEVDEDLMLVVLQCTVGETSGTIQYALPLRLIERFLDAEQDQRAQLRQRLAPDGPVESDKAERLMRQATVTVQARLRVGPASLGELSTLRPGDVLATELSASSPVELWVEQELRFLGQQGRLGSHTGIQITDIVQ